MTPDNLQHECACHTRGDMRIVYCSLHAAAPYLLNALTNTAKLAHKNLKNHNTWLSFRECSQQTCKAATDAIRKAESNAEIH